MYKWVTYRSSLEAYCLTCNKVSKSRKKTLVYINIKYVLSSPKAENNYNSTYMYTINI